MWLLGRSLLEDPSLELEILQDSEATGLHCEEDPPPPKSHNSLRSPHRSVPVHRGMGGTSRRQRGGGTPGHCAGDAGEPAAVCTRSAAIVIQMS